MSDRHTRSVDLLANCGLIASEFLERANDGWKRAWTLRSISWPWGSPETETPPTCC